MKNILLICHEYPPHGGGSGIVASQIVNVLHRSAKVTVLTQKGSKVDDLKVNVRVYPFFRFFWPVILYRFLLTMNLRSYDRIIVNDTYGIFVLGTFFGKALLSKVSVILHGGEKQQFLTNPAFFARLTRFNNKYLTFLHQCFSVVVVSRFLRDEVLQYCPRISSKVFCVYTSIPASLFGKGPMRQRMEMKPSEQGLFNFLSVSRLAPDKGYSSKLKIFKRLYQENNFVRWQIIGTGPYQAALQKQIVELGLDGVVTLIGHVQRQDLRKYYTAADVFWLLSPRESFGLVYAEAIKCGTFAIGRAIGGVDEVVVPPFGQLVLSDDDCFRFIARLVSKRRVEIPTDTRFSEADHRNGLINALF